MKKRHFTPGPKYLTKLRLILLIIALLVQASGALLGWLISLDSANTSDAFWITFLVTAGINLLWWVSGMLLTGPYYRSLHYEVEDDEVIMRVGVITKSVKHVPYRTVTNITVKRGILDRLYDIGTLNIQTAGMSGSTGAEESLEGLENVQEVYDIVATELRRFRTAMAPTAAEGDGGPTDADVTAAPAALDAILSEVRAIRQSLEDGG